MEAPAVQSKDQTESQQSSVQALALPRPKKVVWDVGIKMADVAAEVKLELEVQAVRASSRKQCSVVVRCRGLIGATKITSRHAWRTNANLGSLLPVIRLVVTCSAFIVLVSRFYTSLPVVIKLLDPASACGPAACIQVAEPPT